MKLSRWIFVVFLLALAGCQSRNIVPMEVDESAYVETSVYSIGVGDILTVQVWKNSELSISVPVRPDGKISVPLVGDIQAAGLAAEDLATKIKGKLSEFIRTPQVTVIVTGPNSSMFLRRIRLTGAVSNPTSVIFQRGMTVMDMVLTSGGLTPFANGNAAKLYRKTKEGTQVLPIYLDDILEKGDLSSNYNLIPSDIITVPERLF